MVGAYARCVSKIHTDFRQTTIWVWHNLQFWQSTHRNSFLVCDFIVCMMAGCSKAYDAYDRFAFMRHRKYMHTYCEPLPYLYLTSAVQIILELKRKILHRIPNENVHFRSKWKCNICNAHARTIFSSIEFTNFIQNDPVQKQSCLHFHAQKKYSIHTEWIDHQWWITSYRNLLQLKSYVFLQLKNENAFSGISNYKKIKYSKIHFISKRCHKINRFHRNLLLNQAMSLAIEVCSLDKRWRQLRVSELFYTWKKKKSYKVVRLLICTDEIVLIHLHVIYLWSLIFYLLFLFSSFLFFFTMEW